MNGDQSPDFDDRDWTICKGCGIAKPLYKFYTEGFCNVCMNDVPESLIIDLRVKLDTGPAYEGSAIYGVCFETGVKFGRANDMRSRIKTYQSPWCQPIQSILGLACPKSLLKIAESTLLNSIDKKEKRGEFVRMASAGDVIVAFEFLCRVFYREMHAYSENWRNS